MKFRVSPTVLFLPWNVLSKVLLVAPATERASSSCEMSW